MRRRVRPVTRKQSMKRRAPQLHRRRKRQRRGIFRRNTFGSERPQGVSLTQWSQKKRRYNLAKRRSKADNALRLVRSQMDPLIYGWTGVKAFNDNGYYWMYNSTYGSPETTFCPVYLYDLTTVDTANENGKPMCLLSITNTGQARFYDRQQTFNGSVQLELGVEATDYGSITFIQHKRALLKWAEVKLNCWGATTKSVKYQIQVVRFTDDDLVPLHDDAAEANFVATPSAARDKRSKFWNDTVSGWMHNPVSFSGGDFSKRVKVIRSEEFIIDPNTTIEGDPDPAVKNVRMFINLDRVINYHEDGALVAGANLINGTVAQDNLQTQTRAHPRGSSRIYLIVRSSNYVQNGPENNTVQPSIDLRVRTKFLQIGV